MFLTMLMLSLFMLTMLMNSIKHPLSMGMILLLQTLLIAMLSGNLTLNFWYSYIVFIIMVGGMLVLFIYMTSVASNEKFKFSSKTMIMMTIMMILNMSYFLMYDQTKFYVMINNKDLSPMNQTMNEFLSINKYFNFPSMMILLFLMIYLFITLVATVKITNIKYGPIRQKF